MGLLSILSKNKPDAAQDDGTFAARSADDTNATRNRNKRGKPSSGGRAGDDDDAGLTEKKRARRRLVGAVALVLAVIIGLPMLFDSEPKPIAADIAIQIPSKDKPAAPVAVAASAPSDAAAGTNAAAPAADKLPANAALDKNEELVDAPASGVPVAASKAELKAASAGARADSKMLAAPVVAAVALGTAAAVAKKAADDKAVAATKADAPKVAAASASAALAAKTAVVAPAAKPAASAALDKNADAARATAILEGRLDAKGDPKADARTDAKPAPKAASTPKDAAKASATAATDKPGKFLVQVAALSTPEKINELRAKLSAAGMKSSTQVVITSIGESTRIRVGPYGSREEADKAIAKLKQMNLNSAVKLVPM